jgi:ATP-dependent RNA helicase RhlE
MTHGSACRCHAQLPRSTADYTHRVGRTGRAGMAGVAVSFVASTGAANEAHFRLIERRHGMGVPREVVPGFEPKESERIFVGDAAAQGESGGGAGEAAVPGVRHSRLGLAHDRMHGGVKGRRMSKKDQLRAQHAAAVHAGADVAK